MKEGDIVTNTILGEYYKVTAVQEERIKLSFVCKSWWFWILPNDTFHYEKVDISEEEAYFLSNL